jgi:hypothetical protein
MKGLRQAPSQGAKVHLLDARLVDRLEIAPLVDGAHRRVRGSDTPMTSTSTAVREDGNVAEPPVVVASPLTEAAVAGTRGSRRRRLLAALRAWAAAGQLGPDYYTTVGRSTGARC